MNTFEDVYLICPFKFIKSTNLSWTEILIIDNSGIKVSLWKLNKDIGYLNSFEAVTLY